MNEESNPSKPNDKPSSSKPTFDPSDFGVEPAKTRLTFDPYLAELVMESYAGTTISMTLYAGGTIISGELVSGIGFFDGLADDVAAKIEKGELSGKGTQAFVDSWRAEADDLRLSYEASHSNLDANFIHLKDAVIWIGSRTLHPLAGMWRGRLTGIEGFNFGRFNPKDDAKAK